MPILEEPSLPWKGLDGGLREPRAERGFCPVDKTAGSAASGETGRGPAAGLSLSRRSSQSQKKGYRSSPGTRSRTVVLPQRRSVREQDIRSAVCVPLPQLRNPGIVYLDQPGLRRPVRRGRPGLLAALGRLAAAPRTPVSPPDRQENFRLPGAEAEFEAGRDLGKMAVFSASSINRHVPVTV